MTYFVLSDIHGYYDEMMTALNKNGFDINNPEHSIIICGDLFDRGSKPKETFEFFKNLGERFIYVRGNHEDLLFECMHSIEIGEQIDFAHFSNKTVKTIADFCGMNESNFYYFQCTESFSKEVLRRMQPVLDFISKKSVNFYEIKDYIFVHGWLPCFCDDKSIYRTKRKYILSPRELWDKDSDLWIQARWINGMDAWKQGNVVENKTIVCGHFSSSWGWSHIRQKRKEYPNKSRIGWEKSFEPFVDNGIIAIDACTAYSGIVNCIVIDE